MKFLTTGGDLLKSKPDFKLVGRDDDLKRLTSILMRSRAASVIIVGPSGVGTTALCMGLQASKDDPNAPFDIVAKRIFWLETDKLFSSGNSTEISENFANILKILKRTSDSILIIEDSRDFVTGAQQTGTTTTVIGALNDAVKSGDTQAIIEVRDDDLQGLLRTHSDFRECYTIMDLAEPSGEALSAILHGSVSGLTSHHGIKLAEEAISTTIELTNKYRVRDASLSYAQPQRSFNLLDRALSTMRLEEHKNTPPDLQEKIKKLYASQRQGELAIIELEEKVLEQQETERKAAEEGTTLAEDANPSNARLSAFARLTKNVNADSEIVKEYRKQIKEFQAAVDENRTEFDHVTSAINAKLELTADLVRAEFSRLSGIPASKLNEDERVKLRTLEATLGTRVFGQEDALRRMANAIKVARIGRRNGRAPQASFMLLGPSGVGKTEVSKALSWAMLGSDDALTRFDMGEYMEKHAVAKLIGAPPGYEGFQEEGGILTRLMRLNPNRYLLFDEVEKAHPDIFNIFLSILSDGELTDPMGRKIYFGDTVIIFTSNLGQKAFLDDSLTSDEQQEAALVELEAHGFRPELLNRFNGRQNIIPFRKLTLPTIEKITKREITNIDNTYSVEGIRVVMTDEDIGKFCLDHYDPRIGARGLPGYVKANIEPFIVDTILNNEKFSGNINVLYDAVEKKFLTQLQAV